jgi:hypothetical protein
MKAGENPKKLVVGSVWEDAWLLGDYVVTKVTWHKVTGIFLDNGQEFTVYKKHCSEDTFIRNMSELEMELL